MRNAGRWNPAKKRSAGQRVQLRSINTSKPSNQPLNTVRKPQHGAQKENYSNAPTSSRLNNLHSSNPPELLEDQLVASELRAKDYKRRYHNEVKKTTRAKKRNEVLQEQLKTIESDAFLARTTANTMHVSTSAELDRTQETLARTERSLCSTNPGSRHIIKSA
jgi:ATP-dependent Lon protease